MPRSPAFCSPSRSRCSEADDETPDRNGLAEEFEHRFRPISAGFAVPIFAFFFAGVAVGGADGFVSALTDPVTIGVVAALVLGKPIGIVSTTWLITRSKRFALDPQLRWIDITGVALLAGIGFTVSLLIAELSFSAGSAEQDHAKVAILLASLIAAAGAAAILGIRNRTYRKLHAAERVDADDDGIPDVFQGDRAAAQQ